MKYLPVSIPTNQAFLKQWHAWILMKVSRKFKRDKERIFDAAQNVRLRLLSKDFIGRWFFKHLSDELVDLSQAQRMLGGSSIIFISSIQPHSGRRSSPTSLWRVSDLLSYAKFDYQRYYYSIQGHTIDSESVLRLLGYPSGSYGILGSMYRQGRLKPAELTEHECIEVLEHPRPRSPTCSYVAVGGDRCVRRHFSRGYCTTHYGRHVVVPCPACVHGRELLKNRGVSLAAHWADPAMADRIAKLRWNDRQLKSFLRDWRRSNILRATPLYIMRPTSKSSTSSAMVDAALLQYVNMAIQSAADVTFIQRHAEGLVKNGLVPGVDAGLLKYAEMVTDHEVVNDFKRYSRGDDVSSHVFNNGMSPEIGDDETVAWESDDSSDDPSRRIRVFRDVSSHSLFNQTEARKDLKSIILAAGLTDDEADAIFHMNLREMSAKEYADSVKRPVQKVNRVHASAMSKLRDHRDAVFGAPDDGPEEADDLQDSGPVSERDPGRT